MEACIWALCRQHAIPVLTLMFERESGRRHTFYQNTVAIQYCVFYSINPRDCAATFAKPLATFAEPDDEAQPTSPAFLRTRFRSLYQHSHHFRSHRQWLCVRCKDCIRQYRLEVSLTLGQRRKEGRKTEVVPSLDIRTLHLVPPGVGARGEPTSNSLKPLPYRLTPCFSWLAILRCICLGDGKSSFPCTAPGSRLGTYQRVDFDQGHTTS